MRLYQYVGPTGIRDRAVGRPAGTLIASPGDLERWLREARQDPDAGGCVAVTYVVDPEGHLRVADRHSEHVACAAGGPVLAAGEMFFFRGRRGWAVEGVSNLSTGYCPEPESWPVVAAALDSASIPHPGSFDPAVIFRRCPGCGERNVVKDDWFVCAVCNSELPAGWNFGGTEDGR